MDWLSITSLRLPSASMRGGIDLIGHAARERVAASRRGRGQP